LLQQALTDINHFEASVQHSDTIATKIDLDMLHGHADEVTDLGFALLRIAEGFRGWAHDAERDLATARNVTWKGPRLATATAAAVPTSLSRDQNEFLNQVEEILDDVEDMMYAVEDVHGDDFYDSFDELLEDIPGFDALATKIDQALPTESGDTALDIIENVMSHWTEYQTSTTQPSTLTSRPTANPRLGARSPDSTSISIVLPTFPSVLEIAAKRNTTGDQLHDVRVVIETIQDNDVDALLAEVAAIHDTYNMSDEVHAFVNVLANLGAKAMQEIDDEEPASRNQIPAPLSTRDLAIRGNSNINETLNKIFEDLDQAWWYLRLYMEDDFIVYLESIRKLMTKLDRQKPDAPADFDALIWDLYVKYSNETEPVGREMKNAILVDMFEVNGRILDANELAANASALQITALYESWKQDTQKLLGDAQEFVDTSGRMMHDTLKKKRNGLFNGGDETSSAPNTRHAESSTPTRKLPKR